MRPRDRKILNDFRVNPRRSILVIAAIFVGLFASGMIMTLWTCIPADLRLGYERSNPANIYLRTSEFNNELIRAVGKWDGVKQTLGSSVQTIRAYDVNNELHKVTVQAVNNETWPVNHIQVLDGQMPQKEGEAAIENYKLSDLGLRLGDTITFKTSEGKKTNLTITGVVRDQSIGASDYSIVFIEPINVYIVEDSLKDLDMSEEWNMLRIVIDGDGNDEDTIRQMAKTFAKRIEKAGYQVNSIAIRKSSAHPTADYAYAIASILLLIGILVVFLSGTLTYNTLAAILSSQVKQIAALKTIGATNKQINWMYIRLIFLYSIIALALAVPISYFSAEICRDYLGKAINFENIRSGFVWETIILQVVLGILVPQIAGAIPIRNGTKKNVREAMSGIQGAENISKPSAFMSWMTRLFSRPTALSMRNTFRNKSRLALTLFTLSLGGAIFIGSFNVNEAINSHIAKIALYMQADVDIITTNPYRVDRIKNALKDVEGIDYVEAWGSGTAKLIETNDTDGPSVSIFALPSGTKLNSPNVKSGRWYYDDEPNAIVLSERFNYTYPDLKPGDTIELEINQTGKKTKWTVTGFYSMAGKSGGFLAYMPLSSWKKVSGTANRLTKFQVVTTEKLTEETRNDMMVRIDDALDNHGIEVKTVSRNDSFVSDAARGLDIMAVFMLIMAILVAIVGSIGLTGTMSLNVMERTNEIGILRAIGASNHAVMKNVLTEGLLVGIMSWIIGCVLSIPVGRLLTNAMAQAIFGSNLPSSYTWVGYVLWLVISIILSIAASSAPAKSAVRLTIQEVLSVE